jgi:hypothetical protein
MKICCLLAILALLYLPCEVKEITSCKEWKAVGKGLVRDAAVQDGTELVAEDIGGKSITFKSILMYHSSLCMSHLVIVEEVFLVSEEYTHHPCK